MSNYIDLLNLIKNVKNFPGFIETIFFYDQNIISHFDLSDILDYKKNTALSTI